MYRLNRCLGIYTLICVSILFVSGCATPASVRALSEEQVKVQESYLETQKKYFSLIERHLDSQILAAITLTTSATEELNHKYKKKALAELTSADLVKSKKTIDQFATLILSEQKSDQEKISQIKQLSVDLKNLHSQMLASFSTILSAQKKLNEFLLLKKSDEIAVNKLLSIIGVEQTKVDEAIGKASDIFNAIEKNTTGRGVM